MTHPCVWIIVLHWKELDHSRACLRSLEQLDYDRYHVLLIDNDSDDGSFEILQSEFPTIDLRATAANLGFAGGCNVGIRDAMAHDADYVLLLNNDARMEPGLLRTLVEAAERDSTLGVLTPKVVYADEPERLYGLGGSRLPFRVRVQGMSAIDREPRDGPPRFLDFVFGCCMLIRRDVLEQIGLLDERFFMYYEDIDLCYRAADAGYHVGYLPGAILEHVGAASTRRRSGMREFLLGRSRQLFFRKHVAGWWWLVYCLYEPLYTARFVLRLLREQAIRAAILYLGGTLAGLVERRIITIRDHAVLGESRSEVTIIDSK